MCYSYSYSTCIVERLCVNCNLILYIIIPIEQPTAPPPPPYHHTCHHHHLHHQNHHNSASTFSTNLSTKTSTLPMPLLHSFNLLVSASFSFTCGTSSDKQEDNVTPPPPSSNLFFPFTSCTSVPSFSYPAFGRFSVFFLRPATCLRRRTAAITSISATLLLLPTNVG